MSRINTDVRLISPPICSDKLGLYAAIIDLTATERHVNSICVLK